VAPGRVATVLRTFPFTLSVVALMLVLSVATGTLWNALNERDLFQTVAYGLPSFQAGRWYTVVTGALFALTPMQYVAVTGGFAVLVGWSEWRLGTRKVAIATISAQLVGILGSALIIALLDGRWDWATRVAGDLDVGFSAGALGAVASASATLLPPWRARLRFALVLYAVIAFLYIGLIWDLEHLLAVGFGLALGPFLLRRRPQLRAPRLSRREWRVVAATLFLVAAVLRLLLWFVPADGPLGASSEDTTTWSVLIGAGISLLLANGLRKGRRTAWRWAMALTLIAVAAITIVFVADIAAATGAAEIVVDAGTSGLPAFVVDVGLWLVQFAVLLLGRKAFRALSPRQAARAVTASSVDRETALGLLKLYGGTSLSWMGTWEANTWFVLRDDAGVPRGYVPNQLHKGVGVGLGDPVGPDVETRRELLDAFVDRQEQLGQRFCFFSVTQEVVDWADARGFRHVQVAEEAVIDLPDLEFKGKSWQDVRTALNRATKEGITYQEGRLAEMPRSVISQVRAISELWVGDKELPEMAFTLGGVDEAMDPDVRVGLAVDGDGKVQGVTSWLPAYGGDGAVSGWTLDVMRRLPDGGFRPVTEYLIASACLSFKESGAAFVSLSGAPLAHSADAELGSLGKLLDVLGEKLEPLYGFRSLDSFKAKFKPRHVPFYMVFRDEAALPRISLALTEAYLPDASMTDIAKAGLSATLTSADA
jgi:lysylphosphatidylglycerol synthetase-like protein (DUF2156 family)